MVQDRHDSDRRQATLTVAPSDSLSTRNADYVCLGANDQVVIQTAIDACNASGGGSVHLLDGNYSISATISLYERVPLIGSGWGTIITLANNSDCNMLSAVGQIQTVIIRDLEIEGAGVSQASGHGIYLEDCCLIHLTNLRIRHCKQHGIYAYRDSGWNNVLIAENVAITEGLIHGFFGYGLSGATFINCTIEGHDGGWSAFRFDGTGADNPVYVLINCWCESNSIDINLDGGVESLVVTGGYYDGTTNTIMTDSTVENITIIGAKMVRAPAIDSAVRVFAAGNMGAGAINSQQRHQEIFLNMTAADAARIRSNEPLNAAIPITFTITNQPDVPKTLSGHFDAHANITAYTIVITGVDAKGIIVTETKTEADLWDWETDNAFATITSIIMTERTGTGAGDTMDIGVTDVLGLSNSIYATGDVYKIKKNQADAVVAGAQVGVTYDTYDMSVIGVGLNDEFTIWYRSHLNIVS